MKKMTMIAAILAAASTFAVPQKLATISIADGETLTQQIAKLGEITGMPMIGMMAAGMIQSNPVAEEYGVGPMRSGAVATVIVSGDPEKVKLDSDDDQLFVSVLYPVGASIKDTWLTTHKDLKTKDGAFVVDEEEDKYLAFSKDGQWVSVGNCPKGTVAALKSAGKFKLTGKVAVRADITKTGLQVAQKISDDADEAVEKRTGNVIKIKSNLKDYDGVSIALRTSDKGMDILFSIKFAKDSKYFKTYSQTLPAGNELTFADKDAVMAFAVAGDTNSANFSEILTKVLELLKKHGLETKFLARETKGDNTSLVLDCDALVEYAKGPGAEVAAKLGTDETFEKDLEALAKAFCKGESNYANSQGVSLSLKGAKCNSTPAARFAKAIPETNGKPCLAAGICSIYDAVRKACDISLKHEDESSAQQTKIMLASLPAAGDGCSAFAVWGDGNGKQRGLVRLTPEELKGLVSIAMAQTMGMGGPQMGPTMDVGDDDDDDDED